MKIQRCENCGTKFKYMDLQKSLWRGYYSSLVCENCGEKSVMKFGYRFIFGILTTIPVFFANQINKIVPTMIGMIFIYMVYIGIISVLSPFVFQHSLEKKKMY